MADRSRKLLLALLINKKRALDHEKLRVAKRKAKRRRLKEFEKMQSEERVLFLLLFMNISLLVTPVYRDIWVKTRSCEWWDRIVMANFNDRDWIENFRMQKSTFFYICNLLRPHIQKRDTNMRHAITVEKRVAVTLWRLATNVEYRTIGHLFGISRASVCCIVRHVCENIVHVLMPKYIAWPKGELLKETVELFEHMWGYPQCAGAIDGSHIPIVAPEEFHTDYFNRKGWHSIILQGVVDARYRFTDINVGWPGSVHDARMFSNSQIFKKGQLGRLFDPIAAQCKVIEGVEIPVHLIGDPAYPLMSWLMKAYTDTGKLTTVQSTYNYRLSRARNVVENAFGRLKGRWRCLAKRNDCNLEFVKLQVAACCTLHNICEVHGDRYQEEWSATVRSTELPQPRSVHRSNAVNGNASKVRDALACHFSR